MTASPTRPGPAALLWLLPIAVTAYLLLSHFPTGEYGLPYWACLAGPTAALVAPWIVVVAVGRARRGEGRALSLAVALIALVALAVVVLAWPLDLVPHARLARRPLALLVAGGALFVGSGFVLGARLRRLPGPLDVLIGVTLAAMVETDLYITSYWFDRDFHIFLRAGHEFLARRPVYTIEPLRAWATDPSLAPFVYPPVTLPLFAALASLRPVAAEAIWLGLGLAGSIAALRLFGIRWRWLAPLLLWPPFVQGLFVGNADVPVLVFFAAAPLAGSLLGLAPLVKLQLGLPGLWLVRERRWPELAKAVAIVMALVLATLPIVGLGLWHAWLDQIVAFARLTEQTPPIQGIALQRYVGQLVAAVIALVALAVALLWRGRDGLASLGVASLAASPTLYPHGVALGLPALLRLRAEVLWAALAITSSLYFTQAWWLALAVGFVAPLLPALQHARSLDPEHHPLGRAALPWPSAPAAESPSKLAAGPASSSIGAPAGRRGDGLIE